MSDDDVSGLVKRASNGDQAAWDALVDRYTNLLWSVARGYRLERADAADVIQVAWLRLVEHLPRLRDPERVGAWLATTVRRECLQVIATRKRRGGPVEDEILTGAARRRGTGRRQAARRRARPRVVAGVRGDAGAMPAPAAHPDGRPAARAITTSPRRSRCRSAASVRRERAASTGCARCSTT